MTQINPYPEWRRLLAEIAPLLEVQEHFSYSELYALAGIDVRTTRGRSQFERFRSHALSELGIWFECERTIGYRVTKPADHPGCSMVRVKRGRRQIARALSIAVKTREEDATESVIAAKRQIASSIGAIMQASVNEMRRIRPLLLESAASDSSKIIAALSREAAREV